MKKLFFLLICTLVLYGCDGITGPETSEEALETPALSRTDTPALLDSGNDEPCGSCEERSERDILQLTQDQVYRFIVRPKPDPNNPSSVEQAKTYVLKLDRQGQRVALLGLYLVVNPGSPCEDDGTQEVARFVRRVPLPRGKRVRVKELDSILEWPWQLSTPGSDQTSTAAAADDEGPIIVMEPDPVGGGDPGGQADPDPPDVFYCPEDPDEFNFIRARPR